MDGLETILTRRSIRKYTADPVEPEKIRKMLEAAMSAPSAGDQQPWHFVVITDRAVLDEIPRHHPYASMVKTSPLVIAVCADLTLEKHPGYWVEDCSAAAQNILLAAHTLGLGAVWLGVHPSPGRPEAIARLLGMPEDTVPLCLISIGYPAEARPRTARFSETRIHLDKW